MGATRAGENTGETADETYSPVEWFRIKIKRVPKKASTCGRNKEANQRGGKEAMLHGRDKDMLEGLKQIKPANRKKGTVSDKTKSQLYAMGEMYS